MLWLPLAISFVVALPIVPAAVRWLRQRGLVRENYRGAQVPFPAGVGLLAAAAIALVPLGLIEGLADEAVFAGNAPELFLYVIGVAALGLLDDLAGGGAGDEGPRGWRGHAGAVLAGGFSTGAVKALGSLGLALFVLAGAGLDAGEYLLAVALLVLTTNLFNLLDLRPGRSIKALVLLGAGLTIGTWDVQPLKALGLFLGPILVLAPLDLRERGMLGDTGSNAIGAVAGLWLVLSLGTTGQLVALAVVSAITVYGEFRSISAFVEKAPLLRQLDSLGRS